MQVDARIARNRVISRMHAFATQSLSAGFARWVEYRGKEKGEREEERLHQNLASLSVLRILLAGKAKAFLAWKRHVRRRREVEERRGAGRVRMARVVVQGWRVGAEEERVWREVSACFRRERIDPFAAGRGLVPPDSNRNGESAAGGARAEGGK